MISIEIDEMLDELGDTVSYDNQATPSAPASVLCLVDYSLEKQYPGEQAAILVKKTQVPAPDYRHTFTIDGTVWFVRSSVKDKDFILDQNSQCYLLAISNDERFRSWRQ